MSKRFSCVYTSANCLVTASTKNCATVVYCHNKSGFVKYYFVKPYECIMNKALKLIPSTVNAVIFNHCCYCYWPYRMARKHLHGHHHGGRCSERRTSAAWPPTPQKHYLPTSVPPPSRPPLSPWEKSRVKVRRCSSQRLKDQALHRGFFLFKNLWGREIKQSAFWNVKRVIITN